MKEFIEELIDRLEEYRNFEDHDNLDRQCIDGTIEIVNQLAEEYNQSGNSEQVSGWIPVTEQLPEDDEESDYYETVIVTLDNGGVTYGYYRNLDDEWWVASDSEYKKTESVIAWQYFPDPYGLKKSTEWKKNLMNNFLNVE